MPGGSAFSTQHLALGIQPARVQRSPRLGITNRIQPNCDGRPPCDEITEIVEVENERMAG